MSLVDARILAPFVSGKKDRPRSGSGMRLRPDPIVLGVREGFETSTLPPVRIFLGTEPAQHRAARIFVWSIEKVRDPSRVYEIHMMKELQGFDRRYWLTGFTNYRYAIPHFAGGRGRAIWNDVDQIYLADPAELFDLDMGDAGFMTVPAISAKKRADSSVMLMDCEKMQRVWSLDGAQHERARCLLDRALAVPGLHGLLDPGWNARDHEYEQGRSKLIHYTILHTQPWGPLPASLVYQKTGPGEIWYELEREADTAGYFVFGLDRPSDQFNELAAHIENSEFHAAPEATTHGTLVSDQQLPDLLKIAGTSEEQRVIEYCLGDPDGVVESNPNVLYGLPQLLVERRALTRHHTESEAEDFDGTICLQGLEHLPEADIGWVLERMFSHARHFVYVSVEDSPAPMRRRDETSIGSRSRGSSWWLPFFMKAGARHPELQWMFVLTDRRAKAATPRRRYEGGRRLTAAPRVWLLVDQNLEKRGQSEALAQALGWPYEIKDLPRTRLSELGAQIKKFTGLSLAIGAPPPIALGPPWPDLVIACGSRLSEAARQIAEANEGATRVIQIDGKAGRCAEPYDIVVSTQPTQLQPHPRRIESLTRLSDVTPQRLADRAAAIHTPCERTPRPHVMLLLGKTSLRHELTPAIARQLATQVRSFAEASQGTGFAMLDAGIGHDIAEAIRSGLGDANHVYLIDAGESRAEQHAWLASADALVVVGNNGYRLADAVSTGKPVYIYPLPERTAGLVERIQDSIHERAHAAPLNRRGTVRPQQALEYLCARSFERGLLSPPRDRGELEETLMKREIVLPFGAPLRTNEHNSLRGAEDVAKRARPLLGFKIVSPDAARARQHPAGVSHHA
jgi:mitochondrial fission protein ELM1